MSEETTLTNPSEEEHGNSIPALSLVPTHSPLTPLDIERMCKVFIRLLCSPEREIPHADTRPYDSTSHRRQSHRVRKDSANHEQERPGTFE